MRKLFFPLLLQAVGVLQRNVVACNAGQAAVFTIVILFVGLLLVAVLSATPPENQLILSENLLMVVVCNCLYLIDCLKLV
ncbi:hypothetical protein [Trichlorobacter lovleyi]|uniref:hypothetical protein n=1 Tax=Trichlorobacter lovleyi TaxID=313985 RepID=UPI0023F29388|nr:hypothetical protein [Trichlorobacter lovleyi]